jgi:hypothetical protein
MLMEMIITVDLLVVRVSTWWRRPGWDWDEHRQRQCPEI